MINAHFFHQSLLNLLIFQILLIFQCIIDMPFFIYYIFRLRCLYILTFATIILTFFKLRLKNPQYNRWDHWYTCDSSSHEITILRLPFLAKGSHQYHRLQSSQWHWQKQWNLANRHVASKLIRRGYLSNILR